MMVAIGLATTVELFQVRSSRWFELTDLPQPLIRPSATVCDNHIHVMGWDSNSFSCSLQSLSSNQQITSRSRLHTISWSALPPLPVTRTTPTTFCGQLLIIGGYQSLSPVNSIHQLVDGEWTEIDSMCIGRCWCFVVSPSPDKMMIVGGWRGHLRITQVNVCEECVVTTAKP